MARGPRLDAPGSLHHLIVRGIEKRRLFENDKDREDFLSRLGRIIIEGKARCFAWALIPNHAHMLLRTGNTPLATMMRRLLTGYAVSFNLRHQRTGHLFQNRYKSIVCEEDSYLLELVRYIHLNCVRAGLVVGMNELDRYRWSGHSVIMGNQNRPWQAVEELLSYFGNREGVARRKYRKFVLDGVSLGRREELTTGNPRRSRQELAEERFERWDTRILGSGEFVEQMLRGQERVIQKRTLFRRRELDLEELMDRVGKKFGVTRGEMIGGSQRQVISKARSLFCYLASRDLGLTGMELSQRLNVTPAAIHYAVMRGENMLNENEGDGKSRS